MNTALIRNGFLLLFTAFILFGCKSIGPRAIRVNRQPYNEVIVLTEQQQLLQNIVRLRYGEPTYFLKITSVNTSFNFNASSPTGGFSYSTSGAAGVPTFFNQSENVGAPSFSYSDSPSISYLPLDNREFVTALLEPLTMDQLQILYTGKIHDFLFLSRLIIDSLGDVENASSITGRRVREFPEYKEYLTLVKLMRKLRLNGTLYITEARLKNSYALAMYFRSPKDALSPDVLKIKKMLNVPVNADSIFFTDIYHFCGEYDMNEALLSSTIKTYVGSCAPNRVVHIELRSVLDIMRYLSFAVDVPAADIKAGYVETLIDPSTGRPFDWHILEDGIMHIYSSELEPTGRNIYVKIYTHHHWFFILNDDLDSKVTLGFLFRLMTLVAGSSAAAPTNAPVLTLPVR